MNLSNTIIPKITSFYIPKDLPPNVEKKTCVAKTKKGADK